MKFLGYIFNEELLSTLVGTAISGGIVYWLGGFSFWVCAFSGYLITELVSAANKAQAINENLQINNYKLAELQKQNAQLSDQLWALKEQLEDARKNSPIF